MCANIIIQNAKYDMQFNFGNWIHISYTEAKNLSGIVERDAHISFPCKRTKKSYKKDPKLSHVNQSNSVRLSKGTWVEGCKQVPINKGRVACIAICNVSQSLPLQQAIRQCHSGESIYLDRSKMFKVNAQSAHIYSKFKLGPNFSYCHIFYIHSYHISAQMGHGSFLVFFLCFFFCYKGLFSFSALASYNHT